MKNDLRLPKFYKTLLMLALVLGPFFWLAFTQDGQRRTDLALMFVLGRPEFNAALDAFDSSLTESELREVFPKLRFQCADGRTPYGDRLCGAAIGSFNQIPASSVTLFYLGGQLRAAKVVYRRAYHQTIHDWVGRRVAGDLSDQRQASLGRLDQQGVTAEPVADGALFLRQGELGDGEEPALLWLSRAAINARG